MASAFPAAPAAPVASAPIANAEVGASTVTDGKGTKSEKQPTNPAQPLPAARPGNKPLDKGVMKWNLTAVDHETADIDINFKPDSSKVEAKAVSFVQTVISKVGTGFAYGGGTATNPAKKQSTYQPFEEPGSKKRVDHSLPRRRERSILRRRVGSVRQGVEAGGCQLAGRYLAQGRHVDVGQDA